MYLSQKKTLRLHSSKSNFKLRSYTDDLLTFHVTFLVSTSTQHIMVHRSVNVFASILQMRVIVQSSTPCPVQRFDSVQRFKNSIFLVKIRKFYFTSKFLGALRVTNQPIRLMWPTSVHPSVRQHFRFRTLTRKRFVRSNSNLTGR